MSLDLGLKAQIRSMVFVAGEPIPYFWPMRSFIHHNPLHGLEKLTFEAAVKEGRRLFHGQGFLPRSLYQRYYDEGRVDHDEIARGIDRFLQQNEPVKGVDCKACLLQLMLEIELPVTMPRGIAEADDILAVMRGEDVPTDDADREALAETLNETLMQYRPIYETQDLLYGTGIGDELDELLIKSCLDFFDEGQSVWQMPDRERGFFTAWRDVSMRNASLFLHGRYLKDILAVDDEPEGIIEHVMSALKIDESRWVPYFRRELARLHGWAGFIRWRSNERSYHHGRRFPGDLVDYLAVRLALALALKRQRSEDGVPVDTEQLAAFIEKKPMEAFLRKEFYSRTILPGWAQRVERALLAQDRKQIEKLGDGYIKARRHRDAEVRATTLNRLAVHVGADDLLKDMDEAELSHLLDLLRRFERHEGMIWLEAMEATAIHRLMRGIDVEPAKPRDKRPFAQAMFCIDTRSERLRRKLESMGDYQTFGIAGFFGVPVSFMELGKGSEKHLCPVILNPKNLVMEMTVNQVEDTLALTALEKALHELKESVLTPFVTVEAIGLLFGFDMVGKTVAPRGYNRWRANLHKHKPFTHLLIDNLSRDQADSIMRAVQRGIIVKAVEHELEVPPEIVNDALVRELRETALGKTDSAPLLHELNLGLEREQQFMDRLRNVYRINAHDTRMQMERLGRIGFSLDEQVVFVSQALHAIGLVKNFSRFVLVVGHGSQSENNPYESALDCGACGGNIGTFNARIFSMMANKPAVRDRLEQQGIVIPDDTWFVPATHNTTTDEVVMHDLDLLPSSHPVYIDRLQSGLIAACRLTTQERMPGLGFISKELNQEEADKQALRNAMDWSQVRPEWGLSRNLYFIIGRRALTQQFKLDGRAFLHSYDYRVDTKLRLLDNIITGPLVVGQWINMEHYFSSVDNENYGSGSKVYHNVAGRLGVMTGNLSDLRTGLPAQTVLADGEPYHEPMRLITVIEAPFDHAVQAIDRVAMVRRLLVNGWIRMLIVDPEAEVIHTFIDGAWQEYVSPVDGDNQEEVKVI